MPQICNLNSSLFSLFHFHSFCQKNSYLYASIQAGRNLVPSPIFLAYPTLVVLVWEVTHKHLDWQVPGLTTVNFQQVIFLYGIKLFLPKTKLLHIHSLTLAETHLSFYFYRYTEDMCDPHKRQHGLFTESNYGGNKSLWDDNNFEINQS